MSNEDNKCAKCGAYSGGATLCRKCEKESLKKKPKPKKPRKGAASVGVGFEELEVKVLVRVSEVYPEMRNAIRDAITYLETTDENGRPPAIAIRCALRSLRQVYEKVRIV